MPVVLDRADARLEHEVELPRLGQVAVGVSPGRLLGLLPHCASSSWSARKRSLQVRQSTSGSVKPADVARRLPHARVEDDRGVERDDVLALLDHRLEPARADVVLQRARRSGRSRRWSRGRRRSPRTGRRSRAAGRATRSSPSSPRLSPRGERLNGSRATPLEPPSIRATRRSGETRQSQAREPENNVRTSYEPAESRTRMRAPPSGAFSAVTEPPCASATCRTIASPSPEPGSAARGGAR